MNLIIFLFFLFAVLIIVLDLFAIYWFGGMLIPILSGGGPYVPTKPEILERMIRVACIGPEDRVVDLGSGDGRLVIAAAQSGAKHSLGYEIHPGLVRLSNWKIKKMNLEKQALVLKQSMWKANLSDVTLVFLYQIPYAMNRIKKLLETQLPPGSRIVSHAFKIPGWEPESIEGNILCYKIKTECK